MASSLVEGHQWFPEKCCTREDQGRLKGIISGCRRGVFLELLQQLRGRHRSLRQHGKSWQQRSAARADEACAALSSSTKRGVRLAALSNFLLIASFLALVLVFVSRQESARVSIPRTQPTS